MTFEVQGVDISQPEGRDSYLEVYSCLREEGAIPDFDGHELDMAGDDMLRPWVESDPDEAKEFVAYCAGHADPNVRWAAAHACELFLNIDPDFTIDTIEKLLSDDDPYVRSAADYYHDVLQGEEILDEYIKRIGVPGIKRLIQAVDTVKNEIRI